MSPLHYTIPEIVDGYVLDAEASFFSVVVPQRTVNLISNPSAEEHASGWETVGEVAPDRVTTRAMAGVYSVQFTNWVEYGPVPIYDTEVGKAYTFSCYVYLGLGQRAEIWSYAEDSDEIVSIKTYSALYGGWHRLSTTFPIRASHMVLYDYCFYHMFLKAMDAEGNAITTETDAWQLEEGAVLTTYVDGDEYDPTGRGLIGWYGERHFSQSYRDGMSRAGGRVVPLSGYGFNVATVSGMDNQPVESLIYGVNDRFNYANSKRGVKEFIIGGVFMAEHLSTLQRNKSRMLAEMSSHYTSIDQPITLVYTPCDGRGRRMAEDYMMRAVYSGGGEGGVTNYYQEKMALTFRQVSPLMQRSIVYDTLLEETLDPVGDPSEYGGVVLRLNSGTLVDTGNTESLDIRSMIFTRSRYLLVGGLFSTLGGVSVDNIAKITSSGTVTAFGEFDSRIMTLVWPGYSYIGQAYVTGVLLAGGQFTQTSGWEGPVTARGIAWMNPSTEYWDELATGVVNGGLDGIVNAIVPLPNGDIFVFGSFNADGGATKTFANIAFYDASADAWVYTTQGEMPGTDRAVYSAALVDGGRIVVGGDFTNVGSIWPGLGPDDIATEVNGVAILNYVYDSSGDLENVSWTAMSNGFYAYEDEFDDPRPGVFVVTVIDGTIYAGGTFEKDGDGNWLRAMARWTGTRWVQVGNGELNYVSSIVKAASGELFIGAGAGFFFYTGSTLYESPIFDKDSDASIVEPSPWVIVAANGAGDLAAAEVYSTVSPAQATVVVPDDPDLVHDRVWPVFVIEGQVTIGDIRNESTQQRIAFRTGDDNPANLTLNAGERLTVSLKPGSPLVWSSTRGDLSMYLNYAASNVDDFYLAPGNNVVTVSFAGTSGVETDALVKMGWSNSIPSIT